MEETIPQFRGLFQVHRSTSSVLTRPTARAQSHNYLFSYLSIALNIKDNFVFLACLVFPSVHDDRARVSFIDKRVFRYTNNTVSDYFHLKTDLLFEETKSGKALASLVAPSPTPLIA